MTNLQLWLTIGIPSLLVLLGWMQTNYRFSDLKENMNQRFSQVDQRFSQVDQRFSQVEARLPRLEADYREFYGMEKKLEGRVDELSRR